MWTLEEIEMIFHRITRFHCLMGTQSLTVLTTEIERGVDTCANVIQYEGLHSSRHYRNKIPEDMGFCSVRGVRCNDVIGFFVSTVVESPRMVSAHLFDQSQPIHLLP